MLLESKLNVTSLSYSFSAFHEIPLITKSVSFPTDIVIYSVFIVCQFACPSTKLARTKCELKGGQLKHGTCVECFLSFLVQFLLLAVPQQDRLVGLTGSHAYFCVVPSLGPEESFPSEN